MKIEEGKFYKTRSGQKVGPMRRNVGQAHSDYCWTGENGWSLLAFLEDGRYMKTPYELDLIDEWPQEGPVRTETIERKVIVEGTYGAVHVDLHNDQHVVYVTAEDGWNISPSDLREAAATFIAIAEALESNK